MSGVVTYLVTADAAILLSQVDAAALIGISQQSVSKAVRSGRLRAIRDLSSRRCQRTLLREDVLAYKRRYKVSRKRPKPPTP